jgi:hypothetical protein
MSRELKPGDRVHVTVRNRMYGYQPGASGVRYYVVAMDKDDPTKSGVVFTADEIELDS